MNSLLLPLLRVLSDGEFHSGAALAQRFDVSRASVWNALQAAQTAGAVLHKVRGRGYRLSGGASWLDASAIASLPGGAAYTLDIVDSIDSTTAELMRRALAGAPHGSCLAAEIQHAGRGRRGRTWHSVPGGSLTFSVLWRFNQGISALSGLSLAVGVALLRSLREFGAADLQLKWPNDVLWQYRKLAGILIEVQGDVMGPSVAIIGIGINLRLPTAVRDEIDQAVTDLAEVLDRPVDRNVLLGSVLRHLHDVLTAFEAQGLRELRGEWQAAHAYQDKPVRVLLANGADLCGKVVELTEDGALVLEHADGQRSRVNSGEVHLTRCVA